MRPNPSAQDGFEFFLIFGVLKMIEINVPNVITIALISILAVALIKMAANMAGMPKLAEKV